MFATRESREATAKSGAGNDAVGVSSLNDGEGVSGVGRWVLGVGPS